MQRGVPYFAPAPQYAGQPGMNRHTASPAPMMPPHFAPAAAPMPAAPHPLVHPDPRAFSPAHFDQSQAVQPGEGEDGPVEVYSPATEEAITQRIVQAGRNGGRPRPGAGADLQCAIPQGDCQMAMNPWTNTAYGVIIPRM